MGNSMTTCTIIERLDIVEHIGSRQITGFVNSFLDAFLFQAAKERFSNGIIPAVPTTAHAGFKVVGFQKAPPVITAIL